MSSFCRYCETKIEDNFKNRIIAYSWGIGNLRKYDAGEITELPKETSDYIQKYIKHRTWNVHGSDGENS